MSVAGTISATSTSVRPSCRAKRCHFIGTTDISSFGKKPRRPRATRRSVAEYAAIISQNIFKFGFGTRVGNRRNPGSRGGYFIGENGAASKILLSCRSPTLFIGARIPSAADFLCMVCMVVGSSRLLYGQICTRWFRLQMFEVNRRSSGYRDRRLRCQGSEPSGAVRRHALSRQSTRIRLKAIAPGTADGCGNPRRFCPSSSSGREHGR